MVVIAIGWAWLFVARTDRLVVGTPPVLAVAGIAIDDAASGTAIDDAVAIAIDDEAAGRVAAGSTAGLLGDMLAVGIRRIGVPVIETTQLYAITGGRASGAALVEAARALGTIQVVQAELRTLPDGMYELETRRVDAQTRDLVSMLRTRGSSLIEVVDRMSAQIAMSMGLRVPDGSVAETMTSSLDAWLAYETGLHALHAGDTAAALLRLDDALREDPSFGAARQLRDVHDRR